MVDEFDFSENSTKRSTDEAKQEAARRKMLRERIELREMAKSLHIADDDWDAAFGD